MFIYLGGGCFATKLLRLKISFYVIFMSLKLPYYRRQMWLKIGILPRRRLQERIPKNYPRFLPIFLLTLTRVKHVHILGGGVWPRSFCACKFDFFRFQTFGFSEVFLKLQVWLTNHIKWRDRQLTSAGLLRISPPGIKQ